MKILGTDFDNTLFFKDDFATTKKNIDAIKKFVSLGNIFCIITGRTYLEIENDLKKLNIPYSYLICADGALIFDSNNKCLKQIKLDEKITIDILKILKENGYDPYLETGFDITNNPKECIKISSLYATTKEDGIKITKEISKKFGVYAYASRKHININNPINDKKQAVLRLCEVANLNQKEFHVIGDDINDYEMLETFNSAVVKKHNPIIDKLQLPVYDTLSDYIEYLLKI